MDTVAAPQIFEHVHHGLDFTPFEARWVPHSAKFVVLGQMPRATGMIQVCEIEDAKVKVLESKEKKFGFKCGTFGASSMSQREIATGDYEGNLQIFDLDRLDKPTFSVKAHDKIINMIDGCGGLNVGGGAREIATASRDGAVKVWDPRQKEAVVSLEPMDGEIPADAWAVAFGNSFNDSERCLAAGYDNGDVKLFDLRTMQLRWDTNVKNGVCHLQFDRKDINMNKLIVSTLEASVCVYDLRTFHPEEGYAGRKEKVLKSTVWGSHFLPQNREVFATCGGNGTVLLYKYRYPHERKRKDANGVFQGVPGTFELLNQQDLTTQPIISFDWNAHKLGLCVMACLDQTVRVAICTKLNLY